MKDITGPVAVTLVEQTAGTGSTGSTRMRNTGIPCSLAIDTSPCALDVMSGGESSSKSAARGLEVEPEAAASPTQAGAGHGEEASNGPLAHRRSKGWWRQVGCVGTVDGLAALGAGIK